MPEQQQAIFDLMEALGKISTEMIEYEPLRDVFEDCVAPVVMDLTNAKKLVAFAK